MFRSVWAWYELSFVDFYGRSLWSFGNIKATHRHTDNTAGGTKTAAKTHCFHLSRAPDPGLCEPCETASRICDGLTGGVPSFYVTRVKSRLSGWITALSQIEINTGIFLWLFCFAAKESEKRRGDLCRSCRLRCTLLFYYSFSLSFLVSLWNKRKSAKVFMSSKMGVNISLFLSHSFVCGQSLFLR